MHELVSIMKNYLQNRTHTALHKTIKPLHPQFCHIYTIYQINIFYRSTFNIIEMHFLEHNAYNKMIIYNEAHITHHISTTKDWLHIWTNNRTFPNKHRFSPRRDNSLDPSIIPFFIHPTFTDATLFSQSQTSPFPTFFGLRFLSNSLGMGSDDSAQTVFNTNTQFE